MLSQASLTQAPAGSYNQEREKVTPEELGHPVKMTPVKTTQDLEHSFHTGGHMLPTLLWRPPHGIVKPAVMLWHVLFESVRNQHR